jgi:hypothetical protein
VGLLDTIDSLNLSDDVKARVIQEHQADLGEKDTEITTLRAKDRKSDVEKEIEDLKKLGFSEAPGLLKFVRRIYLSDDDGPGIVMLSDNDLHLSGDERVGATSREEISTAGAVRQLISLLPRNEEGKLELSDQGIAADDTNRPNKEGDNEETDEDAEKARRARVQKLGIKLRKREDDAGGEG